MHFIGKAFAGNANVYIGKDTDDGQLLAVRCCPLEAVSLESIRVSLFTIYFRIILKYCVNFI